MTKLVFLDTETTSLDRRTRRIWDLGYIVREPGQPDLERQTYLRMVDGLADADPMSLRIGSYYTRHPDPYSQHALERFPEDDWGSRWADIGPIVAEDLRDAVLVGAVISFDEETLARELRERCGLQPTWHYHLLDIETLAAGALLLPPPWHFDELLAEYGLTYDEEARHTALSDARMVRDLYDKVMTPGPGRP